MTAIFTTDKKGRINVINDPSVTYTAEEFTLAYGKQAHAILFDQVQKVKSSPAAYYLPRGEMSNDQIRFPFKANKDELSKLKDAHIELHRALLLSYTMLRVQGVMPQVAYIVTFADESERNAELIDRAKRGADFINGTRFFKTEYARLVETAPAEAKYQTWIDWIDRQLKRTNKPDDLRALYESRGKLGFMIDRERAERKSD
ncbi:hypothetical protein AWB78_05328 [Caballeronia calidae]|uniref:Uncharacterized protein n=1 Tax=Caballeronia calidae TaxID=1777139 RepID=A0A158DMA6_9BURK|nr:hypothetical protein [Caballeronia calidae]SAK95326.1 hypothetical protein AWB78_05328 [Caballeronia calidae]